SRRPISAMLISASSANWTATAQPSSRCSTGKATFCTKPWRTRPTRRRPCASTSGHSCSRRRGSPTRARPSP
ncbi:hypothetical protein LTR94_038378, partial [Friedmanniomyces endolithicus]